jgi:uncharacterized protein (DUF433 family)
MSSRDFSPRSRGNRHGAARRPPGSTRDLARALALILSDPAIMGGSPVFRRTRVPVHMITSLIAQGSTQADLLESYPRLTAEMIRLVPVYAAAHPLRGRPRNQPSRDQKTVHRARRRVDTILLVSD